MGQTCSLLCGQQSHGVGLICGKQQKCGHTCGLSRFHERQCQCHSLCGLELGCGHKCERACRPPHQHGPIDEMLCNQRCLKACMHGDRCKRSCGKPCSLCAKTCPLGCKLHRACSKLCRDAEGCEVPRGCEERCTLSCKSCSTPCVGLCAHRCPPCIKCEPFECPITNETFETSQEIPLKAYTLNDCGCTFELEAIDKYVELEGKKARFRRMPIKCPSCAKSILTSPRFAPEIRQVMYSPPTPLHSAKHTPLSYEEVQMVVECLNSTHDIYSASRRWYQCPKGHPFFVSDCGSPRELSRCLDCNLWVGSDGKKIISKIWEC